MSCKMWITLLRARCSVQNVALPLDESTGQPAEENVRFGSVITVTRPSGKLVVRIITLTNKCLEKVVKLFQENRTDVVDKRPKLKNGVNLLHKRYAKQMYHLLDLEQFDGTFMNQVLDHNSISEEGQITVTLLEETEIEL